MKLLSLLAAAFLTASSANAEAHLIGQSFEKKVGEYLVDVGYDTMDITQGQQVVFNATLIKNPGTLQWEYAPFDSMWFQLKKEGGEPFRKVIPLKLPGPVNVRYDFAESGEYELAVAFLQGEEILAQASFDVPVRSIEAKDDTAKSVALVLFSVFLFIVISVVWHRRHGSAAAPVSNAVKPKAKTRKPRTKKAGAKR